MGICPACAEWGCSRTHKQCTATDLVQPRLSGAVHARALSRFPQAVCTCPMHGLVARLRPHVAPTLLLELYDPHHARRNHCRLPNQRDLLAFGLAHILLGVAARLE